MSTRIAEDVTSGRRRDMVRPQRVAARATSSVRERLETGCITDHTRGLDEMLRQHIVGQDGAIGALTCSFSRVLAGMRDLDRPALTSLLLGPTGVGKSETARVLADALFGSPHGLTQVNCEEYAHGHEISKLLGSPPGYVGHQVEPLLSQRRLDEPFIRAVHAGSGLIGSRAADAGSRPPDAEHPLSVVLFDEVEKAHPVLWNAMLGILEEGKLTLGDNSTTDFTRSIVLMTSNVGSREMSAALGGRSLGFHVHESAPIDLSRTVLDAARALFPLEFLNRFDQILVYQPLERHHLDRIFDKFLAELHVRALRQAGVPMLIRVSTEARHAIVTRSTDVTLGARPLRRALETELVDPLSRLIAAHQIAPGDVIEVECDGDGLEFFRTRAETAVVMP